MDEAAIAKLENIYKQYKKNHDNVITAMQNVQNEFGYLPEEAVYWFAERSKVPTSKFFGIITFYSQFHLKPRGKNIITACCGTVCHVKGSDRIISRIKNELKLRPGEDTSRDGTFTLEKISCIGACSIAPVVVVNKKVYGKMNPDKIIKSLKRYKEEKSE